MALRRGRLTRRTDDRFIQLTMTKLAQPKVAPARPPSPDSAAAAYERVSAELDALPAECVGRAHTMAENMTA
jgi:hypothetical protein